MKNKLKNLQIYKKLATLLFASTLSLSLVGCGISETKALEQEPVKEEQPSNNEESNFIEEEYDKVEGSNAVEAAITIMTDSAKAIAESASETKETDWYKEEKAKVKENFDTLADFLLNGGEINGYTIHDVSDSTVETAKKALSSLDDIIEGYIPEYKEKAKEKLKQFGKWAEEKITDAGAYIADKGSELLDKIEEKRQGRQR